MHTTIWTPFSVVATLESLTKNYGYPQRLLVSAAIAMDDSGNTFFNAHMRDILARVKKVPKQQVYVGKYALERLNLQHLAGDFWEVTRAQYFEVVLRSATHTPKAQQKLINMAGDASGFTSIKHFYKDYDLINKG